MKPAPFKYLAARSLDEALALKGEYGDDARFLAGGQSLVPVLNFRLMQPAALIDINPIAELAGVHHADGTIRIGALTRYRALERDAEIARAVPLMHEALPEIAHPQIRNRGTLGGNLAHADPASEMPAIVLALGVRLRAQSTKADRWIAAGDFFVAALTTALQPDEMLTAIEIPVVPPRTGFCFMEVSRRRGDFALAGIAVSVTLGEDGRCATARLALCGVGETPVLATVAAEALSGGTLGEGDVAAAANAVQAALDPPGNVHASKGYQRHLAGVLTKRALRTAVERARHG